MTIILVTTDSIPAQDLDNCVEALNRTLTKWAPKWGITAIATADPKVKGGMAIRVTDTNRRTGAYGYHTVEKGVPVSYISPSALLHNVYGTCTPAHWSKALWNLLRTKITRASSQTSPARYKEGICGVLIHEALEMLADARIDKIATDALKLDWLVEVADHVSGSYSVETVNGNICVIPNATFASYYDLKGVAPFDLFGLSKTPFDTNAPKFYGFTKDPKTGQFIPIVKGSVHHVS